MINGYRDEVYYTGNIVRSNTVHFDRTIVVRELRKK